MRIAALSLVLTLAACASSRPQVESAVALGPGGRAVGRMKVVPGGESRLRLVNRGPGRADHVIRNESGLVLQQGALTEAESRVTPVAPLTLVVVLEAYADAGTEIGVEASGPSVELAWNLAEAHGRAR